MAHKVELTDMELSLIHELLIIRRGSLQETLNDARSDEPGYYFVCEEFALVTALRARFYNLIGKKGETGGQ